MSKPRTLKSALEHGFRITRVDYKYDKRVRVTLETRFYKRDSFNMLCFWIDGVYFRRNYSNYV